MTTRQTGFRAMLFGLALAVLAGGMYAGSYSARPAEAGAADDDAKICEPVTAFRALRGAGETVYGEWENPTSGLDATERWMEVMAYDRANGSWDGLKSIQVEPDKTWAVHTGASTSERYGYRAWSKCDNAYSEPTEWVIVEPVNHVGGLP